jgi:hypothetical protein
MRTFESDVMLARTDLTFIFLISQKRERHHFYPSVHSCCPVEHDVIPMSQS